MTATAQAVLTEALQLPPIDRATLIEELMASFDVPTRRNHDVKWAQEIEQRIDAFDANKFSSRPADDVFRDIR